jgi:hypothetical protein
MFDFIDLFAAVLFIFRSRDNRDVIGALNEAFDRHEQEARDDQAAEETDQRKQQRPQMDLEAAVLAETVIVLGEQKGQQGRQEGNSGKDDRNDDI